MFSPDDARPPPPPIGGAASDHGDMVLTAADGNKFAAYFARAAAPTGAGMVVMPDVRGLHQFYKELAQRFAEAGIDAVAIDYFGRTAGISDRGEGFEVMPHFAKPRTPLTCTSTRARRTASPTAALPSGKPPATRRGPACWHSSRRTAKSKKALMS